MASAATTKNRVAVQAKGLTKLFGDVPGVLNVDLELKEGEFVALLGRNGAGKTTLLKLLAQLTKPSTGTLAIGDAGEQADAAAQRAGIGFLGHNTFLYDELTAQENLLFYASVYGVEDAQEASREMLERVGLAAVAHSLVRQFSRGMKQRLAIARMFLHRPSLLLLDEPFTGLDDRAAALLQEMLREAHRQGSTIVLCTHELGSALELAETVLILAKGKVSYYGPNEGDPERMRELYRRYAG